MHETLRSKPDNVTQSEFLLKRFPPPTYPEKREGMPVLKAKPAMIFDSQEKLVCCYLPGLFAPHRQVSSVSVLLAL